MKPTQGTLDKIEDLFKAQQYKIRYEKGNFKPGSCTILANKVVVVNKFATIDVKIAALVEILKEIEVNEDQWDENQMKLFQNLIQLKES
jgi:hypothetical protein